ncbi:MAG TPA: Xaa-Pro peptidase family protein [Thermomicrobiaceae bacterium]|nr:Xaa-Pro peptidase family protein [Thermomicrobiaceae bacterium]
MDGDREAMDRRVTRAQQLMESAGIDLLVIGPSSDFRYFTGHAPHLSERLTALVIPRSGQGTVVVPRLEAPLIADLEDRFQFAVWDETERPLERVAQLARAAGSRAVAVNDQLWSGFLLPLQEMLPDADFAVGGAVLARLRAIKDGAELALLREASRRTDVVWSEFCATATLVGQRETEIADFLRRLMAAHGLPEVAFCIVASGPNSASPHHRNSDRVVQPGDPIVMDFGGLWEGYYSDITRTPVAGEPDPEFARIYEVVKRAQQAAFEAIRPGLACQDVDRAARKVITDAGYGEYFIHRLGHGLGLTGHEEPYLVEGNTRPLEAGMVVSDEPGIYIPGKWGVRIEDSVIVTGDGAERLNHVSRDLESIG